MTASEVVRKMVDAWNSGDRAAFMGTASPDIRQDEGQESERGGESAWAGDWDVLHTAFPDSRLEIKTSVEAGNRLALEATFRGTHTGPGLSFPEVGAPDLQPTGKRVNVLCGVFYRVEGDRILSENIYGFLPPLLMQLGVTAGAQTMPSWPAHTSRTG